MQHMWRRAHLGTWGRERPLMTLWTFESVALVTSTSHRIIRFHWDEAHLRAALKAPHVACASSYKAGSDAGDRAYHIGERQR